MNMMAKGTAYKVVFIRVRALDKKLSYSISIRGLFNMFSSSPPTIIIHLLKTFLSALKQWDIFFHPTPGAIIRDRLYYIFVFHVVKFLHVVTKVIRIQNQGPFFYHLTCITRCYKN